ncbi:ABC-2 transporter permease [Hazenella sp. IB182357]|uniref:ABC-2 transporter permease n=1 Tax=Polycladospora coralii TaxID=2771432 RepID=A0A926N911_9BACL|nr:ABC-2 transporter permease [Polycladospora coralii]MBD1372366.1 ABC-2 transporter permease [Polycladospora coralii]MBS7531444.1 ABC-2 transporter permease [Polycladospora coralii]
MSKETRQLTLSEIKNNWGSGLISLVTFLLLFPVVGSTKMMNNQMPVQFLQSPYLVLFINFGMLSLLFNSSVNRKRMYNSLDLIKRDQSTKELIFLNLFPIKTSAIVASRYLHTLVQWALCFILGSALIYSFDLIPMSLSSYIYLIVLLASSSLLFCSLYLYMELNYSLKHYSKFILISWIIIMLISLYTAMIHNWLWGFYIIDLAETETMQTFITLPISFIIYYVSYRFAIQKLKKRDLAI